MVSVWVAFLISFGQAKDIFVYRHEDSRLPFQGSKATLLEERFDYENISVSRGKDNTCLVHLPLKPIIKLSYSTGAPSQYGFTPQCFLSKHVSGVDEDTNAPCKINPARAELQNYFSTPSKYDPKKSFPQNFEIRSYDFANGSSIKEHSGLLEDLKKNFDILKPETNYLFMALIENCKNQKTANNRKKDQETCKKEISDQQIGLENQKSVERSTNPIVQYAAGINTRGMTINFGPKGNLDCTGFPSYLPVKKMAEYIELATDMKYTYSPSKANDQNDHEGSPNLIQGLIEKGSNINIFRSTN